MEKGRNLSNRKTTTRALTESALLVAVATVLSLFKLAQWTYGGSVTFGSMIPIILISLKYPFGWALTTSVAYSLIQMLTGFYAPPVENLLNYSLMILLDYVVAFGVLCLAGPIYKKLSTNLPIRVRMMAAVIFCFVLRFLCHFVSGIIIWSPYAHEGQSAWLYSLGYNAPYMLAECVISGAIVLIAGQMLLSIFLDDKQKIRAAT